MDAEHKIQELLASSNAELIRQGNHLIYRLPNGAKFTMSKTPSDHRCRLNEFSNLKHALGIMQEARREEVMETEAAVGVGAVSSLETGPPTGIKGRILGQITALTAERERLFEEAQQCERRIEMLTKLEGFVDDPGMEEALQTLLHVEEPVRARRGRPPAGRRQSTRGQLTGTEYIGSAVQVTVAKTLAATQTFKENEVFDTGDVYRLMVGEAKLAMQESVNTRQSVGRCLSQLQKDGKVVCVKPAVGRAHGAWKKVDLTRMGRLV